MGRIDARRDLLGAPQNQFGHRAVDANGQAVVEGFSVDNGARAGELEFAGDEVLGEIAFADEIGDHVDFLGIDHVNSLAHRRLFFPEAAMDLGEEAAAADFIGVVEVGRRGIRILGGTVADDEKGAGWLGRDGHAGKLARLGRNARQGKYHSRAVMRSAWNLLEHLGQKKARVGIPPGFLNARLFI